MNGDLGFIVLNESCRGTNSRAPDQAKAELAVGPSADPGSRGSGDAEIPPTQAPRDPSGDRTRPCHFTSSRCSNFQVVGLATAHSADLDFNCPIALSSLPRDCCRLVSHTSRRAKILAYNTGITACTKEAVRFSRTSNPSLLWLSVVGGSRVRCKQAGQRAA